MKKLFIIAFLFCVVSIKAQYTTFEPDAATSATSQQTKEETKTKEKKNTPPEMKIEAKYAAGACPEVDGKIEWQTSIKCDGLTAQQIYDRMTAFLVQYCKMEDKDPNSKIAIVNKETHEIGARIMEYVTFTDKALVRDRALLNYTLRINCSDGNCKVLMKGMSYKYEGRTFPAEEMLLDKNALNKTKTNFYKGGFRKFRTKTIDAKDALFSRIAESLR